MKPSFALKNCRERRGSLNTPLRTSTLDGITTEDPVDLTRSDGLVCGDAVHSGAEKLQEITGLKFPKIIRGR